MNETLKTILNRRSIRAYKPVQIKDEELEMILDAGKFAPSGMNQQSWHFTVVQNQDMLNSINEYVRGFMLKSGNQEMAAMAKSANFNIFYFAPTLIIVSGDKTAIAPQANCALALGNMFLAAESLGIGSCWIHAIVIALTATTEGRTLLKELRIPEGYTVYGSGAFGYKAGATPAPAPRKEGTVTIIK
jgi:nitroreductase